MITQVPVMIFVRPQDTPAFPGRARLFWLVTSETPLVLAFRDLSDRFGRPEDHISSQWKVWSPAPERLKPAVTEFQAFCQKDGFSYTELPAAQAATLPTGYLRVGRHMPDGTGFQNGVFTLTPVGGVHMWWATQDKLPANAPSPARVFWREYEDWIAKRGKSLLPA